MGFELSFLLKWAARNVNFFFFLLEIEEWKGICIGRQKLFLFISRLKLFAVGSILDIWTSAVYICSFIWRYWCEVDLRANSTWFAISNAVFIHWYITTSTQHTHHTYSTQISTVQLNLLCKRIVRECVCVYA